MGANTAAWTLSCADTGVRGMIVRSCPFASFIGSS
jgi:hypothetical protein